MTKEERLKELERRRCEQQRVFLEGLNRYRKKGVSIYVDGKECRPEDYKKIFEVKEDGSFYMGDYISAESGILTEIHFDRVYYR